MDKVDKEEVGTKTPRQTKRWRNNTALLKVLTKSLEALIHQTGIPLSLKNHMEVPYKDFEACGCGIAI